MAHQMAAGNSLDSICMPRIGPHVREMENCHSEKTCARIWKTVRDESTYGTDELIQVALVYKYVTRKTPEAFVLISNRLKGGKYDMNSVKKGYKAKDGLQEISNYISSLDREGKQVLACMLILSTQSIGKTVLVELLAGISGKHPMEVLPVHTNNIVMYDSDSEDEHRDLWLDEVAKQLNTLTPVLKGKYETAEEKEICGLVKQRIEDFRELEKLAAGSGREYDKRMYTKGLLKELCSILQGHQVLKLKGLTYQILVGVGEQLYQLLKSVD
ncbi:M protein [Thogotovirus dhoriense]|uniref:M protein n=1 Tax=Thogotovirus dhoriense TaxID=11318 RepID=D6PT88_9ORTO|nr:M protein [Thogotovirus dhoriense]ADF56029.1 M protein [Thogotovirus dhoriense]